jgi:hypothetical protein
MQYPTTAKTTTLQSCTNIEKLLKINTALELLIYGPVPALHVFKHTHYSNYLNKNPGYTVDEKNVIVYIRYIKHVKMLIPRRFCN